VRQNDGYSSVTVLFLLLFISTISLALMYYLHSSITLSKKINSKYEIQNELEDEIYALIKTLADDPTAEADSKFDPVWLYLKNRNNGDVQITLEDISSRFNINFMRTKMLEESSFKELMLGGRTPEDLKLYRGENGFFSDIKTGYAKFFKEETLSEYFTSYAYANFNVTYEDSLKKLYEKRVSQESSITFLEKVQHLLSDKTIVDDKKLKGIFGAEYNELYPLINSEPLLNVNFVPDKVLQAVLFYPYGGEMHKDSGSFYEILLTERNTFEFDGNRLNSLFADLEDDYLRIHEYLGVRTWFWRILARKADLSLEVILSRLPVNEETDTEIKYQIIKWKNHYY
jgi:hypothetical protein